MSQFINGNYDLPSENGKSRKKKAKSKVETKPTVVEEFERQALARLGGSIAFIAKKSLVWNGDDAEKSG